MPALPDPNFGKFGHGVSLLGGWLPLTIEIAAVWPDFYAIHKIEAANLKRILEYRFANA